MFTKKVQRSDDLYVESIEKDVSVNEVICNILDKALSEENV